MYYCVYFSLCRLHYEYIIDSIYIAVVTILFISSRETYSLPYNSYGKNSTTIYLVKNFYGVDHFHNLNVTLHLHKNFELPWPRDDRACTRVDESDSKTTRSHLFALAK